MSVFSPTLRLTEACRSGDVASIQESIANGADVNFQDSTGFTPLHIVSSRRGVKPVKAILAASPNLELEDQYGETALHLAARYGTPETIRVLIDAGLNPLAHNKHFYTPLDLANNFRRYDLAEAMEVKK